MNVPSGDCTDSLAFAIPDAPDRLAFISICPATIGTTVLAQPTEAVVANYIARRYYRSAGGTVIVILDALVPPAVAARIEHEVSLMPE